MPEPLARLLHSRKFWIALVAVAQSVVFSLCPAFPQDVWKAVDALAIALIASIAYEDAAGNR